MLRNIQVQLADDSLHAFRFALREKTSEIFEGLDGVKLLRWRDVHNHRFVIAGQVDDVIDGALALAVSQHEAIFRRVGHRAVLEGVVVEALGAARGIDLTRRPVPDVVPAMVLHAVHENVRIRPVGKVPLDRLVGAVRITDENLKLPLDHRIEVSCHLGEKPRNLP